MLSRNLLIGGGIGLLVLGAGVVYARRENLGLLVNTSGQADPELNSVKIRNSIDLFSNKIGPVRSSRLLAVAPSLLAGSVMDFSLIGDIHREERLSYAQDGYVNDSGTSFVLPSELVLGSYDMPLNGDRESLEALFALLKTLKIKVFLHLGLGHSKITKNKLVDLLGKSGVSYELVELSKAVESPTTKPPEQFVAEDFPIDYEPSTRPLGPELPPDRSWDPYPLDYLAPQNYLNYPYEFLPSDPHLAPQNYLNYPYEFLPSDLTLPPPDPIYYDYEGDDPIWQPYEGEFSALPGAFAY